MGHMKIGAIVCFFAFRLYFVSCQNIPSLDWQFDPYSTDQWFKQKLDHYDSGNVQHWPQRYITSYRYYRLGGPMFLYLSGPGPELTLTDIESGAIAEYAEEQGAFLIGLEHRFYGKSRPTSDISTANLQFLTIPQTIEDIAAFVRSWRARDEFRNSKWVVFGASYLGSLAAWFAQKHPELIDVFVASSAPLELRYEIPEFLENVGLILNETNPKCYDTVAEGFSCLTKVFNEEDCENYSLADVKDKFDFCAELDRTRPLDATGVFAELFSTINAVVMYHDPSPDSFPDTNLDRFCKLVTADNGKPALDKIGERVKEINKHREVPCAEFRFQTTVDFLKEQEWDSPAAKEGYRQLQWQLCNELGWTVASANISQPFGNYLTPFLHSEICQNLFSLTETEMRLKVLKANTDLKGKGLNTKCGIFVNGDMDPWRTFSITTPDEAGQCNRAILIDGGSHGRDIEDFTSTPAYPTQVRDAQLKIAQYLDLWIKTGRCCDEDTAESKRVISSLSRPARAPNPKDYYFNNLLKEPKVDIKHRAYPQHNGGNLPVLPTALPLQVSTTDVLSVSPRIPVVGSTLGTHERDQVDANLYRDPRNTEFRRYRVVKLLRHRPSFAAPTEEPSRAPSMEQFEADFPEHSIRVEGRVERVFKNGTLINSTGESNEEVNEQQDLYDKGRRILQLEQIASSNEVTPLPSVEKESSEELGKKNRFRYVVKQVFKDVVSEESTDNVTQEGPKLNSKETEEELSSESSEEHEYDKSEEVSRSPKKDAKREQSLGNNNVRYIQQQEVERAFQLRSGSHEESSQSTSSSSEQQASFEDPSNSKFSEEGSPDKKSLSTLQKRESGEMDDSYESSKDESISTSESIEHFSIKQPPTSANDSDEVVVKVAQKPAKSKANGKGKEEKKKKSKEYYEDDYDDEYYDDDDYYDEYESDEDRHHDNDIKTAKSDSKTGNSKANKTTKATAKPVASTSKIENSSTEFSSGEYTRPRRLREKISEKIMSSSETVEGDQKSKEKTKLGRHNGKKESTSNVSGDDKESLEDVNSSGMPSKEIFSSEDYNYSLEPSGSNPKGSYRKKQLAPITKAVMEEEPSTVRHVEMSGSYPKRSSRKKKIDNAKDKAHTDSSTESSNETTEKPKRVKKTHHRRKKAKTEKSSHKNGTSASRNAKKSVVTTTSTTTSTTTTEPPTTSILPEITVEPPTNNYAAWNRGRGSINASPVQHEAPNIVSLGDNDNFDDSLNNSPDASPNDNNDVIYIILGDIPKEDNPNMIDDNPSHESLFNFIQKLVSRHSPGVFPSQQINQPMPPPTPLPTTTTTTTTFAPPVVSNHANRYIDQTGKYLLVRPVQVVSLGREHVVHAHDLKNESLIDLMTMETPLSPYQYEHQIQGQNTKRQNGDPVGGSYRFKSPLHRDHFEKLLSVDGQIRDSDRDMGYYRHSVRRLDQIPDPSWRSIRGVSQFGPVAPLQKSNPMSSLLSLSAADTRWVDEGVPFLPRSRQLSSNSHRNFK